MSDLTKCVIDCETTGLDRYQHDLIQLAIVPINDRLEPIKEVLNIRVKALTPETACQFALQINGLDPLNGLNLEESKSTFYSWLTVNAIERIVPIAFNYAFDFLFIEKWLVTCGLQYKDYFHYAQRDVFVLANCANDARRFKGMKPLFTSTSLGSICNTFGIEHSAAHDALSDCYLTLEVYKKLLMIA